MDNPKISVIIPVYNVEPYLRRCIDSVIGQTYTNLEIILVDDGSTDNCGAICDEYAARDDRIQVLHRENGGVSAARNAGLVAAGGEWVGFVDADDYIEPDMYEYMLALAGESGADIAQCGFFMEEGGASWLHFCRDENLVLPDGAASFSQEEWKQIGNSASNKLYRAEALRGIAFELNCTLGEDLLFNVHVLRQAAGIVLGKDAKYHYVQREGSACHIAAPTLESLTCYRKILRRLMETVPEGSAAYRYFETEQLRNDMDVCSKLVRFWQPEFEPLRIELRREVRGYTWRLLTIKELKKFEKAKLLLLAWNWELYRLLLLLSKRSFGYKRVNKQ